MSRSHSCNAQTAAAPQYLKPLWQWKKTSFIKVIFISEICLLRETLLSRCHDSLPVPVLSVLACLQMCCWSHWGGGTQQAFRQVKETWKDMVLQTGQSIEQYWELGHRSAACCMGIKWLTSLITALVMCFNLPLCYFSKASCSDLPVPPGARQREGTYRGSWAILQLSQLGRDCSGEAAPIWIHK